MYNSKFLTLPGIAITLANPNAWNKSRFIGSVNQYIVRMLPLRSNGLKIIYEMGATSMNCFNVQRNLIDLRYQPGSFASHGNVPIIHSNVQLKLHPKSRTHFITIPSTNHSTLPLSNEGGQFPSNSKHPRRFFHHGTISHGTIHQHHQSQKLQLCKQKNPSLKTIINHQTENPTIKCNHV